MLGPQNDRKTVGNACYSFPKPMSSNCLLDITFSTRYNEEKEHILKSLRNEKQSKISSRRFKWTSDGHTCRGIRAQWWWWGPKKVPADTYRSRATLMVRCLLVSVSICPTGRVRRRRDADTRVQASLQLLPAAVTVRRTRAGVMMERIAGVSQRWGLVLAGETRRGLDGDLVSEFHVDFTKVDGGRGKGDQRDWIVNGRLNGRNMGFSCV